MCCGAIFQSVSENGIRFINDYGKAVKLTLTPEQRNDITEASSLLEEINAEHVIADKAYDSDDWRKNIRNGGVNL